MKFSGKFSDSQHYIMHSYAGKVTGGNEYNSTVSRHSGVSVACCVHPGRTQAVAVVKRATCHQWLGRLAPAVTHIHHAPQLLSRML